MLLKLKGRGWAELSFRLRQEIANAVLAVARPGLKPEQRALAPLLPDPRPALDRLRRSGFAAEVLRMADGIRAHQFELLGFDLEMPAEIPWRRDVVNGRDSKLVYFRRVPYLDFHAVGDHKIIWEINRHQHLVVLAQAWRFSGQREYLDELVAQLEHWFTENPFQFGINWTSALEVAFRALSWIWVDHLAGADLPEEFRARLVDGLYRHGLHLEYNLSYWFSPNTHLQGEAVALHALGVLYPRMPRAEKWAQLGAAVVSQTLRDHVLPDGAHFEQSTYYHVYALDFFLFHYLLAGRPAHFAPVLERMADYLHAWLGRARRLPFSGDDDGGRVFHPYGPRDQFGRATLATCARLFGREGWLASSEDVQPQAAWWLGEPAFGNLSAYAAPSSRVFRDSGAAFLSRGRFWVAVDAGPFGGLRAGHSHSDTLNVVVRAADADLLIDPGTYSYLDPAARRRLRSSAAHNTVRINGRDQGPQAGPFAWGAKPRVQIGKWETTDAFDAIEAEWASFDGRHVRRVELRDGLLRILDHVEPTEPDALVEQFWHPGLPAAPLDPNRYQLGQYAEITFRAPGATVAYEEGGDYGWRSRAYGDRDPAPLITVSRQGPGPVDWVTEIRLV